MLKHHTLICTGLAATFAVPVLTGQEGDLSARLAGTVATLEELLQLEPAVASGEVQAIERVLELTGEPLPQTPERTQRLDRARADVARLAAQLDALEAQDLQRLTADPSRNDLTPEQRTRAAAGAGTPAAPTRFEGAGYSADAVREARLLIRAERFEEALTALAGISESDEATYLRARAHQGLGRGVEALELFRALAAQESQADVVRWARQEVRMIELRQKLDSRNAKGGQQ